MTIKKKKKVKNTVDGEADRIEAYQRLFATEDGQEVLYDLMRKCNFVKPTYDPDIHVTMINEGEREAILYIIEILNRDVEELYKFVEQQEKARSTYDEDN